MTTVRFCFEFYFHVSMMFCRLEEEATETIQLSEDIVNLGVKLGPQDFELKKVLGKGGYGKVFQVTERDANSSDNLLTLNYCFR